MKIIGIVAADNNWAIGKKNGLLYELKEDMRHFRETTSGHFVVMGVNTVDSLPGGKALKNRITICIDQEGRTRNDCLVVRSTDECLRLMGEVSVGDDTEFYICGGGYCYRSFLPYYDKVIVTKVDAEDGDATAFFPNLDKEKDFKVLGTSDEIEDNGYKIRYLTYERTK